MTPPDGGATILVVTPPHALGRSTAPPLHQLRAWSYRRQRLGQAAADPIEALRNVVAVYSSHPTAPLALLARAPLVAQRFVEMEQRREALRIPAMRTSIFLAPTATASRLFSATRLPLEQHARRLAYAGLDWDEYERLKQRVLALAREPTTTAVLQREIATDARLMTGVRLMALEGLVLRLGLSLRTDSLRYVAAEAWLGHPLDEVDPEQSLVWLAEAYLRGYGPARVADFAWWCGITRRRAQAALAHVDAVDVGGGLLLPTDLCQDFAQAGEIPADAVDALPKWDAYTMGYAPDGRQRLVDDRHLARAYSRAGAGAGATSGDGLPLLLRGGHAVATWSHRFAGDRMLVTVTPFEPGPFPLPLDVGAFHEAGRLLEATAIEVALAPSA